jgi:hypothetical protein
MPDSLQGAPAAYQNWHAQLQELPVRSAYEYPLISDGYFGGMVDSGFGPYQFLNPIAPEGMVRPAVYLRISYHAPDSWYLDPGRMNKTDTSRYHGGQLVDELAALLSLGLGARLKAGPAARWFNPGADPRGMPIGYGDRLQPTLLQLRPGRPILPHCVKAHSLNAIERWSTFPQLTSEAATTVVRVARQYQDAIWIAESEPSLAWLMLVTAIETAANYWRTTDSSPLERLRVSRPALVTYLEDLQIDALAERVATEVADSIGSTKKFVEFLLQFLPGPPPERPSGVWAQISWDENVFRTAFRKIYGYRSKALHDGTPFPLPMCQIETIRPDSVPCEKPTGLAVSAAGGVWVADDLPMSLHTFEYIAREALLKWWGSLPTSIKATA